MKYLMFGLFCVVMVVISIFVIKWYARKKEKEAKASTIGFFVEKVVGTAVGVGVFAVGGAPLVAVGAAAYGLHKATKWFK